GQSGSRQRLPAVRSRVDVRRPWQLEDWARQGRVLRANDDVPPPAASLLPKSYRQGGAAALRLRLAIEL
ncbi:MAG: hypothetical protein AVDCRST_MAG39-2455, partial [uncultured Sphingomonadaceae bacterium]